MRINRKNKNLLLERSISGGAILLFSSLIRYGFEKVYRTTKGYDVPKDPYSAKNDLVESLLWGAAIGALIGTTTTLVRPLLNKELSKFLDS